MTEFVIGARWVVEAETQEDAAERLAKLLHIHVNAGREPGVEGMEYLGVYSSTDSPSDAREMVEQARLYSRSPESLIEQSKHPMDAPGDVRDTTGEWMGR